MVSSALRPSGPGDENKGPAGLGGGVRQLGALRGAPMWPWWVGGALVSRLRGSRVSESS